MKNSFNKVFTLLVVILGLTCLSCNTSFAATKSGKLAKGVTWSFNTSGGVLTISGNAEIGSDGWNGYLRGQNWGWDV